MMRQEKFRAGVQYDDFKGTAAADRHDRNDFSTYLKQKGLIHDEEFLVGVEMWSGEVHGPVQDKPVSVTALITDLKGDIDEAAQSDRLQVRRVEVEISLGEFFGLFKRFHLSISSHGILDGRDYSFSD
ncbi:hypothetical protein D3C75_995210 [compost metagenome]